MKFYIPKFLIATMQSPQMEFRSKFGGLPWGLQLDLWRRCEHCGRLMSLLAQLSHDPPALDLGGSGQVLHLFQCQDVGCNGFGAPGSDDAMILPQKELGRGLTPLPNNEDLSSALHYMIDGTDLKMKAEGVVGELWIDGWEEHDDGFDSAVASSVLDQETWLQLPDAVHHHMFDTQWRTKMGGIPYWTGNGPMDEPRPGYEFLFQLDDYICLKGKPPTPDECGGRVTIIHQNTDGDELRQERQEYLRPSAGKKKMNAPWDIIVETQDHEGFGVEITNLGTDGTAYVFINRETSPASAYWFWLR